RPSTCARSSATTPAWTRPTTTSPAPCSRRSTRWPPTGGSRCSGNGMRLEECVEIAAPRTVIWDVIADAERHPLFMAGLTRWDVKSGPAMTLGSRIDMRMAVGSAQVGSLIEVVEFDAPADMAWTSVTGIDQRGRWRLRELGPDRTKV